MERSRVLAIIPARGASKRVPRKNLRLWHGKPLIVHSIEHARAAALVDRVVVSTEDAEIRAVALAHGAEVVERPLELAADDATSESALLHVLEELDRREAYRPDLVVFLQCTSPSRPVGAIDTAIQKLLSQGADSLLSACKFNKYIWRVVKGRAEPINYDHQLRWRDQEFPPQFMENGSIYVFRREVLQRERNRLGGKIVLHEMTPEESFQIDEASDFEPQEAK